LTDRQAGLPEFDRTNHLGVGRFGHQLNRRPSQDEFPAVLLARSGLAAAKLERFRLLQEIDPFPVAYSTGVQTCNDRCATTAVHSPAPPVDGAMYGPSIHGRLTTRPTLEIQKGSKQGRGSHPGGNTITMCVGKAWAKEVPGKMYLLCVNRTVIHTADDVSEHCMPESFGAQPLILVRCRHGGSHAHGSLASAKVGTLFPIPVLYCTVCTVLYNDNGC
jgi:hypothetical protein